MAGQPHREPPLWRWPTPWFVLLAIAGAFCLGAALLEGHPDRRLAIVFLCGVIPALLLRLILWIDVHRNGRDAVATRLYFPQLASLSWEQWKVVHGSTWSVIRRILPLVAALYLYATVFLPEGKPPVHHAPPDQESLGYMLACLSGILLFSTALLFPPFLSLWKHAHYLCGHPPPAPLRPQLPPDASKDPSGWMLVAVVLGGAFLGMVLRKGPLSLTDEWSLALGVGFVLVALLDLGWKVRRFGRDVVAAAMYLPGRRLPSEVGALKGLLLGLGFVLLLAGMYLLLDRGDLRPEAVCAGASLSFAVLLYPAQLWLWRRARAVGGEAAPTVE